VKKPRLVLSDAAIADVLEQADWYRGQSGAALAKRWEKSVTSALQRILKNPAAGRLCTFRPVELRDVRRATISGFPKHLLFYSFQETEVFLLRVVHGTRDLENLF
jgi:plasmid stabilization system protein ParE